MEEQVSTPGKTFNEKDVAEKEEVIITECPVQSVVVYPDRAEVLSSIKLAS